MMWFEQIGTKQAKPELKAVNKEGANLIAMGAKGSSNVPGELVGSTAEKMCRRCPVPILSLRGAGQKKTPVDR